MEKTEAKEGIEQNSKDTFIKQNHQAKEITDMDLKAVFRLVDVDKSGSISRTVSLSLLVMYVYKTTLMEYV